MAKLMFMKPPNRPDFFIEVEQESSRNSSINQDYKVDVSNEHWCNDSAEDLAKLNLFESPQKRTVARLPKYPLQEGGSGEPPYYQTNFTSNTSDVRVHGGQQKHPLTRSSKCLLANVINFDEDFRAMALSDNDEQQTRSADLTSLPHASAARRNDPPSYNGIQGSYRLYSSIKYYYLL